MKLKKILTKLLCLLIVISTLLLTCACANEESNVDSDSTNSTNATNNQETAGDEIVLSGNPSFRIIYSSAYKSLAESVSKKLISLDKNYTKESGKYTIAKDTDTPADGTPEILIGTTNRTESTEAKNLVSGKVHHYSIYATNTAIALYSNLKAGVEAAVDAFIDKLSKKDGAVIYDNSKGNIAAKYEAPEIDVNVQIAPSADTRTIEKTDIDVNALLNALSSAAGSTAYSIAVSSTSGIQVKSLRNTNAQNTYSVSKVFCVTAIGMLYDEGKIKTSDTIGEIFKDEIKAYGIDENRWKNITIHDVMKHNVGFTKGGLLDIDADPSLMNKHDDFLKVVLNYSLDGKKTYKYTDAAYYLISRVVAKISGQKLDAYLKSRLFDVAEFKDYKITKCPQGHPIGATQFFLRPDDVVKLGRIYLNGGTYNGKRIISQDWVNKVIENGYELKPIDGNHRDWGFAKGGMNGQYIYVSFKHNIAVIWLSETDGGTGALGGKLKEFIK